MGIIQMKHTIRTLNPCAKEVSEILAKYPEIKRTFANKMDLYRGYLKEFGSGCVQRFKPFECLGGSEALHSLRLSLSANIRILYAHEKNIVVFLLCMVESEDKKNYKRMMPIAEQRLKKYREGAIAYE